MRGFKYVNLTNDMERENANEKDPNGNEHAADRGERLG